MRSFVAGAAFVLTLVVGASSPRAQTAGLFRLKPMDLFGLSVATDPEIRPDGGAVAYVRVSNDVMSDRGRKAIWIVDVRTGAQSPLGATGAGADAAPRSPDGRRPAIGSPSSPSRRGRRRASTSPGSRPAAPPGSRRRRATRPSSPGRATARGSPS